jgi:hypothetical protein
MPRPIGMTVRSREVLAAVIKGCGGTGAVAQKIGRSRQLVGALASGKRSTTAPDTADAIAKLARVPLDDLFMTTVAEDSAATKEEQ